MTKVEVHKVTPPTALLVDYDVPALEESPDGGVTNGALLQWSLSLLNRLREVNANQATLRAWAANQ